MYLGGYASYGYALYDGIGGKQFEIQKIATNSLSILLRLSSSWSDHYRRFYCIQYCV